MQDQDKVGDMEGVRIIGPFRRVE